MFETRAFLYWRLLFLAGATVEQGSWGHSRSGTGTPSRSHAPRAGAVSEIISNTFFILFHSLELGFILFSGFPFSALAIVDIEQPDGK